MTETQMILAAIQSIAESIQAATADPPQSAAYLNDKEREDVAEMRMAGVRRMVELEDLKRRLTEAPPDKGYVKIIHPDGQVFLVPQAAIPQDPAAINSKVVDEAEGVKMPADIGNGKDPA